MVKHETCWKRDLVMSYTPLQGDIIIVSFDPSMGHEQKGKRPGVVVSNYDYHARTNDIALVCPITNSIGDFPMHVLLDDRTNTTGAIMCEQIRCIDISACQPEYIEVIPDDILDEVIDLICSFVE